MEAFKSALPDSLCGTGNHKDGSTELEDGKRKNRDRKHTDEGESEAKNGGMGNKQVQEDKLGQHERRRGDERTEKIRAKREARKKAEKEKVEAKVAFVLSCGMQTICWWL